MSLSEEHARRNRTWPEGEQKENHEKRGKKVGEDKLEAKEIMKNEESKWRKGEIERKSR
jgi:hypothetical protein